MQEIKFNGFPEKIGEHIDLPNIAELMLMPCFRWADIDDVYKYGTEFQRFLISKTPISNKNKYINIITQVQFLQPSLISLANRVVEYERNWHFDGSAHDSNTNDQTHLLINDVDARTEFNTSSININYKPIIGYSDYIELIRDINKLESQLTPKKMEPNKILTFTPFNIHRAPKPSGAELRFMWRAYESNHRIPLNVEQSMSNRSIVGRHTEEITSVETTKDKITIYLNN